MAFLLNFQPCVCKYFQENFNRLCAFKRFTAAALVQRKNSFYRYWIWKTFAFFSCFAILTRRWKEKNIKGKNNTESFAKKKALLKLRVFYHLFVHSSLLSGDTPGFKWRCTHMLELHFRHLDTVVCSSVAPAAQFHKICIKFCFSNISVVHCESYEWGKLTTVWCALSTRGSRHSFSS